MLSDARLLRPRFLASNALPASDAFPIPQAIPKPTISHKANAVSSSLIVCRPAMDAVPKPFGISTYAVHTQPVAFNFASDFEAYIGPSGKSFPETEVCIDVTIQRDAPVSYPDTAWGDFPVRAPLTQRPNHRPAERDTRSGRLRPRWCQMPPTDRHYVKELSSNCSSKSDLCAPGGAVHAVPTIDSDYRNLSKEPVKNFACYSCKGALAASIPKLENDAWTATCPACGVLNKLTPVPDQEGDYVVSGAYFIVRKDS